MGNYEHDALTEKIIGCCFEVHKVLGPGFAEKVYSKALQHQLQIDGIAFEAEKEFDLYFKDRCVGKFRWDFFVEGRVIVEIKSFTGMFAPVLFQKQILSYLKAANVKTGLLINFGNISCTIKRLSI
ncbi:MAG TPA: GxxExxY protein [Mucilaginibacter sp.]